MTSKISGRSAIEQLGHQIDALGLGLLTVGVVALGARGAAKLIVLREEVENENRSAGIALVGRVRRAFVAVNAVQNGVADRAGILTPISLIRADVIRFFSGQAVVTDLHRSLYHVGIPRPD